MSSRKSRWLVFACLAAVVGCGPSDEIRSYEVKRAAPLPKDEEPVAKFRLMGAIIPVGDQSWFVKFSGPAEKIDPHAKSFDEFLKTIRITNDPGKPITYDVPAEWSEAPAKQMRYATFHIGKDRTVPDPYISTPFGGTLLANVNRWRGEAGLKDVVESELSRSTTEILLGTTKAYRVDFRGPGGKSGMPPFMMK